MIDIVFFDLIIKYRLINLNLNTRIYGEIATVFTLAIRV